MWHKFVVCRCWWTILNLWQMVKPYLSWRWWAYGSWWMMDRLCLTWISTVHCPLFNAWSALAACWVIVSGLHTHARPCRCPISRGILSHCDFAGRSLNDMGGLQWAGNCDHVRASHQSSSHWSLVCWPTHMLLLSDGMENIWPPWTFWCKKLRWSFWRGYFYDIEQQSLMMHRQETGIFPKSQKSKFKEVIWIMGT